jgi:prolyl-tRNA editing enzyme YbaK/EbsC (Cys-tRNA(Pro) deacylase)
LARPQAVNAATDFAASLVSPVLLPEDILVLADSCLGQVDVVYAPTGDGGTALGIPTRWLLTASHAATGEMCAPTSPTVDLSEDMADDGRLSEQLRDWH